jgi:hypothetical protein
VSPICCSAGAPGRPCHRDGVGLRAAITIPLAGAAAARGKPPAELCHR